MGFIPVQLDGLAIDGDIEFNIVIRTVFVQDGMAYIQAGAGIVIDSNPKHEYKESLKKARAMESDRVEQRRDNIGGGE